MTTRDVLAYAAGSVFGYRARTLLTLLAVGIGVASVVMLTALGSSDRRDSNEPVHARYGQRVLGAACPWLHRLFLLH